jgi:nanoRNase/pAp phosphatase (c-di-AMP/oligoRNAs hydrolase)
LMANFISSLGLKIDVDISSNLLSGIVGATDNFQSSQTSSLAFETAAFLLKKGAVRQTKEQKRDVVEDSFFTPISNASPVKQQEESSTFPKMTIGTEEKKPEIKLDENNPPDDWLSPKIYRGSTNV